MSPSSDALFHALFIPPITGHPENDLTDDADEDEDDGDAAADDRDGVEATDIESTERRPRRRRS